MKSLIVFLSVSPSIEVIIYLRRVVKSTDEFLLIFLRPSISLVIFNSSSPFRILNVMLISDEDNLKANSFIPLVINDSSNTLFSRMDKSTVCSSPL